MCVFMNMKRQANIRINAISEGKTVMYFLIYRKKWNFDLYCHDTKCVPFLKIPLHLRCMLQKKRQGEMCRPLLVEDDVDSNAVICNYKCH